MTTGGCPCTKHAGCESRQNASPVLEHVNEMRYSGVPYSTLLKQTSSKEAMPRKMQSHGSRVYNRMDAK
jgi:hypothetical protein